MGEANFLQALMTLAYWEALTIIVKTSLLDLANDFWHLLLSLRQEIQDFSCNFSQLLIQWHILAFHSLSDELE